MEGWEAFEGHTPHKPHIDAVKVRCSGCGAKVSRITDVGNPWLDAGIVPFSTMHFRSDPEYWKQWFPADFVTESFPGQFRNWFYSLLAMSTVLRREAPFKTLFGYALVYGEDGRQMHKSWGNAIEFDEAAERMGVDVMRWMFANAAARGQHQLRLARRRRGPAPAARAVERLLVLRHLRTAGCLGAERSRAAGRCRTQDPLDRWILARVARLAKEVEEDLRAYDALDAARAIDGFVEELSTWYLRRSRKRFAPWRGGPRIGPPPSRRCTPTLVALARIMAPILPFLSESIYQNLVVAGDVAGVPDSVHLTHAGPPRNSSR